MKKTEFFIGIDVSKDTLDVGIRPTGESFAFPNTGSGIALLVQHLKDLQPKLIVVEATGGLETAVVGELAAHKFPVAVINPRQGRDFAKATGKLAKTDEIDAHTLAHFGDALRPEVRPLKNRELQELTALVSRRRQLVEMRTAEKNRLFSAPEWTQEDIKEHISWLDKKIAKADSDLGKKLRKSPVWREKDEILQSMKGVGDGTSLVLITELPELGTLNRKKIATLVGVAPLNRDSGLSRGKRAIWGGRASVRTALYMATLAAIQHKNPVIRPFYERLVASGKAKKVAITACMHKMLTIMNAMVRDGKKWDQAAIQTA